MEGNFLVEQSTCLAGGRLLYFFMSSSNFLIPRLIASARSHSSCLQYSLRILLEHPSNLTVIRSFLGLSVGRPVLGDICSILLSFVCHNLYYILCLPKVKSFFQNIFYPTNGIKIRCYISPYLPVPFQRGQEHTLTGLFPAIQLISCRILKISIRKPLTPKNGWLLSIPIYMKRRYLAGVPFPAFLLTRWVRSSTISTSNIFLFIVCTL